MKLEVINGDVTLTLTPSEANELGRALVNPAYTVQNEAYRIDVARRLVKASAVAKAQPSDFARQNNVSSTTGHHDIFRALLPQMP